MGLTTKGRDQGTDLTAAYVHIATHPGADVLDVAAALGAGTRLAREIVGILVKAELVSAEVDQAKGHDTYKIANNVDPDREAVMGWIEASKGEDLDTAPVTRVGNTRKCTCGCGSYTNHAKSLFLPGHDARMAGQVARAIVASTDTKANNELLATLPSEALRRKAVDLVARWGAKADAKAKADEPRWVKVAPVKVGRWEYPARRSEPAGEYQRNTKRDGSGEWVPVKAK